MFRYLSVWYMARDGGLMSYGIDLIDLYRRAVSLRWPNS